MDDMENLALAFLFRDAAKMIREPNFGSPEQREHAARVLDEVGTMGSEIEGKKLMNEL